MSNKLIIPSVITIVVVAGVAFFVLAGNNQSNTPLSQNPDSNNATGTIETGSDQMVDASDNPIGESNSQAGSDEKYVTYSEQVLSQAQGKKKVLYFYANWCPTCKAANDEFTTQTERIPNDTVVIRTNYNDTDTDQSEKDLAAKYNITYQHTFVYIDDAGNEITKWNGGAIDQLVQKTN